MEYATFPPRAKSKARLVCCVKNCESRINIDLDIAFHSFPLPDKNFISVVTHLGVLEKWDRSEVWKQILHIKEVNRSMKVCSRHFKMNDYIFPDVASKKRTLKKCAVPTQNLPIFNAANTKKSRKRGAKIKNEKLISNVKIKTKDSNANINLEIPGPTDDDTLTIRPIFHFQSLEYNTLSMDVENKPIKIETEDEPTLINVPFYDMDENDPLADLDCESKSVKEEAFLDVDLKTIKTRFKNETVKDFCSKLEVDEFKIKKEAECIDHNLEVT